MKRSLILILVLAMTGGHAADAEAARLRGNIMVNAEVIRLGDVFVGADEAEDIVIATAPAPGKRRVFGSRRLGALAERHGIDWRPASRSDKVVVVRQSRLIEIREIEDALKQALGLKGISEKHRFRLSNGSIRIYAATDQRKPFEIEGARYDARTGRFSAALRVPYGAGAASRVQIVGRLITMVEIPVPTRRIRPGDIIGRDDIDWIDLESDQVRASIVADASFLIGKTPRRILQPGRPVQKNNVRAPVIVHRGSIATLMLATQNMILAVKVKILQDGAMGDTIRVINTRSQSTIEGVVSGPGRVDAPQAGGYLIRRGS